MEKNLVMGLVFGTAALGSAAAIGIYQHHQPDSDTAVEQAAEQSPPAFSNTPELPVVAGPEYARVTAVEEITETYLVESQQCWEEAAGARPQSVSEPVYRDENNIAGTAIGAIIGGIIGNQVGGGSGKKIATIAGAVAGGYAGRRVQDEMEQPHTAGQLPGEPVMETRCETVKEPRQRLSGYRVSYTLNGEPGSLVMSERPGDSLPVVDGEVITETQPPQG